MTRLVGPVLAVAISVLCAWRFGLHVVVWWLALVALAVWLAERASTPGK